jgi:hypothetical protein
LQCDRKVYAKQLCRSHHRRMVEGKSIAWSLKAQRASSEICTVPGCSGDAFLSGLCARHWRKARLAEMEAA